MVTVCLVTNECKTANDITVVIFNAFWAYYLTGFHIDIVFHGLLYKIQTFSYHPT